ncbi:MAG: family 10 glycosylhydrolase, partial [Armatimonadota bacterium]|nr:family 10 glycosylhydrolase [Armatimonadota bacterium]
MASALPAQEVGGEGELSLEELRQMRREIAHSPRGIIANNDGCDVLYFPGDVEVTVENFLDQRTTALAGTHVGAIAFCPTSSGFSFFTHDTKVGTVLTRHPGDYGILPDSQNIAQDLIDLGSDCLQSVVDFGHANDMEVFFSMRMNDTHDNAHRPDKPYLLYPPLKEEHPEWLVGNWEDRTPYGRWSSVDYARPEIRDLAFGFIEEVCRNYDVDGVELDFFRHLCYFASVANGGTASQQERDMMTDLLRRVRAMTEEVGRQRGRPILVSVRVADSVGFDRDMGLDIERWLEEDLVDILITTCYFRLNPWEYSVELGHRYDVAVYPCLSDSRVRGETRFHRRSVESYRGRAMNAWTAGADGIHLFNFFNPDSPVFREVGD